MITQKTIMLMTVLLFSLPSETLLAKAKKIKSMTTEKDRRAYVLGALKAVASSSSKDLATVQKRINAARSSCRSKMPSIEMECLLQAEKSYCKLKKDPFMQKACLYHVDIVMNNKLSESFFLSNHERYKALKNSQKSKDKKNDPKAKNLSYNNILMSRYAHLVSKMVLWDGVTCPQGGDDDVRWACLAKKISTFCEVKATVLNLSWQSCIGANVWFVGNQGRVPGS